MNVLGGESFLKGNVRHLQPGNVCPDPCNELRVDLCGPVWGFTLTEEEKAGYNFRKRFQVPVVYFSSATLLGRGNLQDTGMRTLLTVRSTLHLGEVEVRVHPGFLVQEPGFDEVHCGGCYS